jgi:hypothetical protein
MEHVCGSRDMQDEGMYSRKSLAMRSFVPEVTISCIPDICSVPYYFILLDVVGNTGKTERKQCR